MVGGRNLNLNLRIEKGPREGETLKYSSTSKQIKIGRVVKGNTIAIKDSGISSKHMTIQFDNQWTLCDLDSSNGTVLNSTILKPYVPSVLNDGDRIKIGELTLILVNIEVESNPRPQGKSKPEPVVENEKLGLGFDGELGKNEPVRKRNLRDGAKNSRNEGGNYEEDVEKF